MVDLDEDGVGSAGIDALFEEFGIGHEKVVTDQLGLVADGIGQFFPAGPVVFVTTIFNRDDRELLLKVLIEFYHLCGGTLGTVGLFENILFLLGIVEFGRGDIEGEEDVLAEFVSGLFDGGSDDIEGGFVGLQNGSKSAFVTDCSGEPLALENGFESVEDFTTHTEGFAEGLSALRHDHEFLDVNRCIGMRAAVHYIHHGHGQYLGIGAPDVFIEGEIEGGCGGLGCGQ